MDSSREIQTALAVCPSGFDCDRPRHPERSRTAKQCEASAEQDLGRSPLKMTRGEIGQVGATVGRLFCGRAMYAPTVIFYPVGNDVLDVPI